MFMSHKGEKTMDNLLVIALIVVSCIVINPFISASENAPVTEQVAAADQNGSDDQNSDSDDDEDEEEDENQDQESDE